MQVSHYKIMYQLQEKTGSQNIQIVVSGGKKVKAY